MQGLVHTTDNNPGFSRKKHGRGFRYFDEKGEKIKDPKVLKRIKQLAIPPMWKDVWICPEPGGHLQVTGLDNKSRKQYLYHEDWLSFRQENKFERLREFGYSLPEIRNTIAKHIELEEWNREKVIALIIGILDETYVRVGNKRYLELNETHGLTTLRRKHMKVKGQQVIFKYRAKSKKMRKVSIDNPKFVRLIKECSELPGYEIFRYRNDEGKLTPVTSIDVNEYLQEIAGDQFTSKNFRTWGGTVMAVKKYPVARQKTEDNKRLKLRRAIVKEVANELSNTISISEKYYIHPLVLERLDDKEFSPDKIDTENKPDGLDYEEKIVLGIIQS
jgi:DNA topoisomerase-1